LPASFGLSDLLRCIFRRQTWVFSVNQSSRAGYPGFC